jgi:hypothetical protein
VLEGHELADEEVDLVGQIHTKLLTGCQALQAKRVSF